MIRRLFLLALLLPLAAWGQLTSSQLTTVKTAILADPVLAPLTSGPGTDYLAVVNAMNSAATPTFVVWKSLVPNADVGKTFVASGLSAMSAANNDRLVSFALWNPGGVQPFRADHRQFFDDVFSIAAGASTRAALLALWKRPANRVEKLFATGVGSDASPAQLVYEGGITLADMITMFQQ
jgi:hypothetical protein